MVDQDLARYDWATKYSFEGHRKYVKPEDLRFQGKKNATNGLLSQIRNLIRGSRSVPNRTGAAVRQSLVHNIQQLPPKVKDCFEDYLHNSKTANGMKKSI